ncbi:MAG: Flp/Fap pilin component [Pseudomonadota bacterium]
MNMIQQFKRSESGATAIEYSMIAAMIGLAIITAALALGVELVGVFESVQQGLEKRVAVT